MTSVRLPQGTLRYVDVGSGPVVVFIHGLLVDHRLWDPVIAELSSSYRCVAPDLPLGSHQTAMSPEADLSPAGVAALVADFLDALDLSDVTLVGNDSGGAIAQLVAADHPERLARLVLTNCDALEVFPPEGFGYLSLLPKIPGAMWLMSQLMAFARLRRLPMAYGKLTRQPIDDALLADWTAPARRDAGVRRDVGKFAKGVTPEVTLAVAERLGGFDRPALLLWGADDRFFPVELAERLARRLPDARVETVEGGATFVALDRPDAVAEAIDQFIGQSVGQPVSA